MSEGRTMHARHKVLLRTAERISAHVQQLRAAPLSVELPEEDWNYSERLLRQLDVCHERDWRHAAALLEDRLRRGLERCCERFQEITRQVSEHGSPLFVQRTRDIVDDLVSLADEFEGVSVDGENRSVSVTTESIVVEEINLGPFEIRLHWDRIGDRRSYRVIALNPNPAGESSDTTHPHVKGEQLCEGDGRQAIDNALRGGRLLDFFHLVGRILETYNAGSAYVALSEWNGSPCSDCGDVVSEEERYTCDRCGDSLCHNCLCSCVRCEAFCCHACTNYCRRCEESICSGCQETCRHCARSLCRSCISETGLCEECQEEHDAHALDEDEDQCPPLEAEAPASPASGNADPQPATASVTV
jgi:hypothetical protein